jgi:hypothetical protein
MAAWIELRQSCTLITMIGKAQIAAAAKNRQPARR